MKTLSMAILGLLIAYSPAISCDTEGAKLIAQTICEVNGGTWGLDLYNPVGPGKCSK